MMSLTQEGDAFCPCADLRGPSPQAVKLVSSHVYTTETLFKRTADGADGGSRGQCWEGN